jgi:hypothetical protein
MRKALANPRKQRRHEQRLQVPAFGPPLNTSFHLPRPKASPAPLGNTKPEHRWTRDAGHVRGKRWRKSPLRETPTRSPRGGKTRGEIALRACLPSPPPHALALSHSRARTPTQADAGRRKLGASARVARRLSRAADVCGRARLRRGPDTT